MPAMRARTGCRFASRPVCPLVQSPLYLSKANTAAADSGVPVEYLDVCTKYSNMTEEAREAQLDAMRRLVTLRLVPLHGRMDALLTAGLQRLVNAAPEVYAVVGSCYGTDGLEPKQVWPGGCTAE